MISAKTAPLAGSPEDLQWRMPTSPLDYPDRNPVLSEEERRGIEHLLSLSSWQWRAFEQQLALLERITKPLLDVIMLFQQRRPKSLVSCKHFIDHLLGHVLQTNTVYWGWSSSMWQTVIQSIPTRPKEVAQRREPGHTSSASPNLILTHLAAYLLTGQLHLTREKPLRVLAFGEIVFGPEFVLGIHPQWVAWIRAFWQQTPLSQRHRTEITGHVLLACRWLAQHYPQVTEPSQWTREIALAYVAYVCNEAIVFDYASPLIRQRLAKKVEKRQGEPLKPASMSARLQGLRAFFRGLRKYSYEIDGRLEP